MKKIIVFLLLLAAAIGLIALGHVGGLIKFDFNSAEPKYQSKGKLEVVCELDVSKPNETLTPPFDTVRLTMPAQFDFDENTGWYTGEYTISMNRKGTLHVRGDVLEVSRPAMFKRYGLVITGEHFTLDRKNGEFRQWLDLDGDKRLDLITGYCKRTTNAPF